MTSLTSAPLTATDARRGPRQRHRASSSRARHARRRRDLHDMRRGGRRGGCRRAGRRERVVAIAGDPGGPPETAKPRRRSRRRRGSRRYPAGVAGYKRVMTDGLAVTYGEGRGGTAEAFEQYRALPESFFASMRRAARRGQVVTRIPGGRRGDLASTRTALASRDEFSFIETEHDEDTARLRRGYRDYDKHTSPFAEPTGANRSQPHLSVLNRRR